MSRITCFALTISLLGSPAFAQGDAMTELYGEGVHRYFAGDYVGADQVLSQVVDSGSLDPRVHYFRGLARNMLGGGGDMDFENGARLEAEGKRVVAVGLALIRIQGGMRSKIEKARRDARVVLRHQQLMAEKARREAAMVAPAGAEMQQAPPPVPSETVQSDPFSGNEGLRSADATVDAVQPATPEIDAATDPFGDDPAPAVTTPSPDTPATSDPFTDPAGAGTDNPADPFNTSPAGGAGNPGDPFNTTPAGGAGDAADPFGTPPAGGGGSDDPFGGADPFGTGT